MLHDPLIFTTSHFLFSNVPLALGWCLVFLLKCAFIYNYVLVCCPCVLVFITFKWYEIDLYVNSLINLN